MDEIFMSTHTINGVTLALLRGNIVEMQVDAIVNAANSGLGGGGGVDGAIHRAGGPGIMEECRKIGGCSTRSGVATTAGRLPPKYDFYSLGPLYSRSPPEERLLARAHPNCPHLPGKKGGKKIP